MIMAYDKQPDFLFTFINSCSSICLRHRDTDDEVNFSRSRPIRQLLVLVAYSHVDGGFDFQHGVSH